MARMAAPSQEDSLLSPIAAAADRSESTTLLVSEGSGRSASRASQAFEDGARPPPLARVVRIANRRRANREAPKTAESRESRGAL
jgi:hypothetical protein